MSELSLLQIRVLQALQGGIGTPQISLVAMIADSESVSRQKAQVAVEDLSGRGLVMRWRSGSGTLLVARTRRAGQQEAA